MYTIGYDLGSSSVKASLVATATGKSVAVVQEPETEMAIKALENGWAEQDPELWWTHVCNATKKLLAKTGITAAQISAVGISYQMHGLVVVDQKGAVIRDAIIWCDSRAVAIGNTAFAAIGTDTCASHLLNSPANFTASKLKWVAENEPDNFGRIYKFMLPGDYIAFRLTGIINTTPSGLSEGILWDFKERGIAKLLLEHYGIPENTIPDVVPTFSEQGTINTAGSAASGLAEGTVIKYRAGDQPNNALSLNIFQPGEVAATGGTSGVMYAVTDSLSSKEYERVNNFAHVNYTEKQNRIGKLLCINGCGILYRWLKDNTGASTYEEMNALAAQVPIGSKDAIMIPFGNGAERMLKNQNIGVNILNLNLNIHTKAHLCRAALEGIAFSFIYGMEMMMADGVDINVIRAGNDNLFRASIFSETVATLIGHDIEIYNTTGAIGAARAAGIENGDVTAIGKAVMENDYVNTYSPNEHKAEYQKAYEQWKTALEKLLSNN